MRTSTTSLPLISALAALAVVACSGGGSAPGPDDIAVGTGTATAALEGTPSASAEASPSRGRHDPAEFVKRFDTNGDGKLELSELPLRMQAWLGKADADHDGTLSAAELSAQRDGFLKQRFARMDKSGDGVLTLDEVGERRWEHLRVADADGNGQVTEAEMSQAIAAGALEPFGHRHHDGSGVHGQCGSRPPEPPATAGG
jgi:hypothetical protein